MQINQRLYLLSILKSSDLQRSSLHLIFNALVILINSLMLYLRMLVNLLPMTKTRLMLYQERPCDVDWHCIWHGRSYWRVRSL